jgi:hypothetical protein
MVRAVARCQWINHLTGELADGLADLAAEHRPAHLPDYAKQRPGHLAHFRWHHLVHGGDDAARNGLDKGAPDGQCLLDPFARPRRSRLRTGRNRCYPSSQWSASARVGYRAFLRSDTDRRLLRHGLPRHIAGEVPVDRSAVAAGQHPAEVLEDRAELGGVHCEHGRHRVLLGPELIGVLVALRLVWLAIRIARKIVHDGSSGTSTAPARHQDRRRGTQCTPR